MDKSWAMKQIAKADFGYLGTVGSDGTPYVTPLNHMVDKDTIVFHCAPKGKKLRNILNNPNVSYAVCTKHEVVPEKLTTRYESAIAFGKAFLVEELDEKRTLFDKLMIRLAPKIPMTCSDETVKNTCLVRIIVENVTGKKSEV